MELETFVQKSLALLDKERDCEVEETRCLIEMLSAKELERRGVCLLKLQLKARKSGLYGRMVVVFEPCTRLARKNVKQELPSHNITPGDIVGVELMKGDSAQKPLVTGTVSQVTQTDISVAFEESQDVFELNDDELYKLTKLANDITYKRLKRTLNDLAKYRDGPSRRLIDTLFYLEDISSPCREFPITFLNQSLDESQREAVQFALTQKEVAIIHGPPGTGKTTTVVELIVQAVKQGLKVLAAAPSNIAVDNLVERLASCQQKIVRIGHPARLLTHLQKYSLDAILSGSDERGIIKDVRTDLQKAIAKLRKAKGHGERQSLREEIKELRRETRGREEKATSSVLTKADVVLVTLTSATDDGPLKYLQESHFDLVVIDECSQALEAACWIALLRVPRCVLAGDHLQLPPTILSKEAATSGLEVSLMERLLHKLPEKDIVRMLTVQYRMHLDIMSWSSQQLYQGSLTAHSSVTAHLLRDLEGVKDSEVTSTPLLVIDTTGCDLFELDLPEEVSKGNEGEADIVAAHVEKLIRCGVKPADIAVIAPYNLQVDLLRNRLSSQHPDLEVKSVDGFQGREKEAVVISMVRSNKRGKVGFLAEKRRINVAVTRARRHLAVICDMETVCHDPFIKSLVDYLSDKGQLLSAHHYIQEGDVKSITRSEDVASLLEPNKPSQVKKTKPSHPVAVGGQKLQTKEEKSKQYQEKLEKFASDPTQLVLHFPASLNSHDRLVIHEVAEKLGLSHVSCGEGKDRYIEVSKHISRADSSRSSRENPSDDISGSNKSISSDGYICGGQTVSSNGQAVSETEDQVHSMSALSLQEAETMSSVVDRIKVQESSTVLTDTAHQDTESHKLTSSVVKSRSLETKEVLDVSNGSVESHQLAASHKLKETEKTPTGEHLTTLATACKNHKMCQFCGKKINTDNFNLHELHCSRQKKRTDHLTLVQDKPKKENTPTEKKKEKAKKSHVQKASDVLSKVDDDDFEGLMAAITALDSKCAFQRCKTLTNTLGSNCPHCTRRFCLSHLMPEVHGCGEMAKVAARQVISRDGVLHRGSGVPDRKPNQAKRALLESKMDKKLAELEKKRASNAKK